MRQQRQSLAALTEALPLCASPGRAIIGLGFGGEDDGARVEAATAEPSGTAVVGPLMCQQRLGIRSRSSALVIQILAALSPYAPP